MTESCNTVFLVCFFFSHARHVNLTRIMQFDVMRINIYSLIKHHFLTLIIRTLRKKYEHEKKTLYWTKFSAQNCDMTGNFCIQILNQHMKINLYGQFSFMLP
jgi:hypothetical protein